MLVVPADIPVIIPVVPGTTIPLPALQVPPAVLSVKVIAEPIHTDAGPAIPAGAACTTSFMPGE